MSDHAISNAKAWLETVRALAARMSDEDDEAAEAAREEVQDSALSVMVRDGWYAPGTPPEEREPDEYEVLLTTGGPALRIVGDLGSGSPVGRPRLEWQDWGTPWTEYITSAEDEEALAAFVGVFYFGG